ncbi:MAG TPA: heme-binding protein [Tepidisphaeraceae bacterium]|nr:heme-binding protein [Tepidisphaeraceae bacterium]
MSGHGPQPGRVCLEALESRTHLAAIQLSRTNVSQILAQAASQARAGQAIAVTDRDGAILGIYGIGSVKRAQIQDAIARAQTAALFESAGEAFTTRTARFIIQDHFPFPVSNTPGGPLYGVEFSSLPGSDVFAGVKGISGDPGGVPLYINGQPVGGVGVAGDGHDVAPREDLAAPGQPFFSGREETDFDEAVALAGAQGFMAPASIRADKVFLDGLRLPFVQELPAIGNPSRTLDQLTTAGVGSLKRAGFIANDVSALRGSPGSPFPAATVDGVTGQNKNPNPAATHFGTISSNDLAGEHLTFKDVNRIIAQAVNQSQITRGAIRQPIGTSAQVHIAVVDRNGDVLGVFATGDATNFSYDVAVQKARTAAYFSDDTHAFSTRAIGFISQRFFPAGIDGRTGPFYQLQNQLSVPARLIGPLKNGITIFPGGIPLYKNGQFVGAIGISGDGVDQDDLIAYAGTTGFRPANAIRSDALGETEVISFLKDRFADLVLTYGLSAAFEARVVSRLDAGLNRVQLPYVKFPRNPNV